MANKGLIPGVKKQAGKLFINWSQVHSFENQDRKISIMYTDPIADFLTRIRNAVKANHRVVEIPASNLKKEITKILFDQGIYFKL